MTKVTISFRNDALLRSVRVRAAEDGRQIRDIVEDALTAWLDAREEAEDTAASTAALREYDEGGGEDADAFFRRMVAEGQVRYDDT